MADKKGRLAIVKCRRPDSIRLAGRTVAWDNVIEEVEKALAELNQAVSEEPEAHSRGNYCFVNWGYSYGGGQEV